MASSVPPPVAENWCYTEQKMEKVSYMWTINNFKDCFHENADLFSPEFPDGASKTLWQLRVQKYENVYISIILKSAQAKRASAKYKCSVVNGKQEKRIHNSGLACRIEQGACFESKFAFAADFLFNNQLPEDKITIFCEIFVMGDCVNISGQSNIEVDECKLSEDFSKLLDDEKFTDVTLVVDGQEFQAHKAILVARSVVFAAMFEHEFEERKSNCVEITDIRPEVLREMLHFIYTGKAPNVNEVAKDLLEAADKYALEKLNLLCEKTLTGNLSVETAAETLILADRHNAKQLRAITLAFINMHAMDVMQTPDWQKMVETHPYLMAEAFQAFAAQQCSKIKPNTKET